MNKKRKRQLTNRKKRFIIINVFLALFLFIGIGYSTLNVNLDIIGNIIVKKRIIKAENLSYNNSTSGVNCQTAQCMIDCIADSNTCP